MFFRPNPETVSDSQFFVVNKPNDQCSRCGFKDHSTNDRNCPARKVKCEACEKFGHYARMCGLRKRSNSSIQEGNQSRRSTENSRDKRSDSQPGQSKDTPSKPTENIYSVDDKSILVKVDDISLLVADLQK